MSPTSEEVRGRLRLALRDQHGDLSPGLAFRQSPLGQKLARSERLTDRESVDVVPDPWALRNVLHRSMSDVTSMLELEADADRVIQLRPTPTALLPLCTIVPTSSTQIPIVPESLQIDDAAYSPDGQNLPGITGAGVGEWTVDYLEAVRVGRIIPVPLAVLDDDGQAEAVIDKLVTQNWRRAIESYVLSGSYANLVGITNTAGIGSVDATSTNLVDALAQGVADVMSGGYYGGHAVIASPQTLKAVWGQKDLQNNYLRLRSALPTVSARVPAPGVPANTAIVADPSEILVYLQGSFTVSVTQQYLDFLSRGMAAVMGQQRAAIWIRNPDAFVVVENL